MTQDEKGYLKSQIRRYIQNVGIKITRTDADRIQCPMHGDDHASMIIYEKSAGARTDELFCPVCGAHMDIFEFARVAAGIPEGDNHFPEVIRNVQDVLGMTTLPANYVKPEPTAPKPVTKNTDYMAIPVTEAHNVYTLEHILSMAQNTFKENVSEIESAWKNVEPDGKIAYVEVRFPAKCFSDGKKKYLTYWYDGKNLRSSNPPILLYNRDKLAADKETPFCIHEGPKCIFAAEQIPGFITTGYNSGGKKWKICDWEPLRGRIGYIYPDDDDVGRKTALDIKKMLEEEYDCKIRVCEPLVQAREIKPNGADIVECLCTRSPEEMADYIRNGPELSEIDKINDKSGTEPECNRNETRTDFYDRTNADNPGIGGSNKISTDSTDRKTTDSAPALPPEEITVPICDTKKNCPFRVLGIANDDYTYFIDCAGNMVKYKLQSLTKGQMLVLAPLPWWDREFGGRRGINWDDATDFIVRVSQGVTFDPQMIRGIGAWRENDDKICYNTGKKTYGEIDDKKLYLKRTEFDIGLDETPADFTIRREMFESARLMSFDDTASCARLLSWAILAPFGGALPWRPAGFITGESGSGKSTVIDLIVKKLSASEICSGMSSTPAGILQHGKYKSTSVIIDEAGDDNEKAKKNRKEIFEIMRQSTGNDAPKGWKGTADGTGTDYELQQMFLFAAINPVVGNKADANRIFYVTMQKAETKWQPIRDRIKAVFTTENCRAVRSWTWQHLQEIISGSDTIIDDIEDISGKSHRDALIDALLFSAYFMCFKDGIPDESERRKFFSTIYAKTVSEDSNDADELLDRLLDEQVNLIGEGIHKFTLRRIMYGIFTGRGPCSDDTGQQFSILDAPTISRYKQTAIQYGLGITTYDNRPALAIASNHFQIAKITETGRGYNRILWRHAGLLEKSKQVNFSGIGDTIRRCVIIKDIFSDTDDIPF